MRLTQYLYTKLLAATLFTGSSCVDTTAHADLESLAISPSVAELGVVGAGQAYPVDFTLQNPLAHPVFISGIRTSCECIEVLVDSTATRSFVIPPHATRLVTMRIRASDGAREYTLQLLSKGGNSRELRARINGKPALVATPKALQLPEAQAGDISNFQFTVHVDAGGLEEVSCHEGGPHLISDIAFRRQGPNSYQVTGSFEARLPGFSRDKVVITDTQGHSIRVGISQPVRDDVMVMPSAAFFGAIQDVQVIPITLLDFRHSGAAAPTIDLASSSIANASPEVVDLRFRSGESCEEIELRATPLQPGMAQATASIVVRFPGTDRVRTFEIPVMGRVRATASARRAR